jgi:cytochrome c-type biogenesis protein CcmH
MLLWVVFAVITAAASIAIVAPYWRRGEGSRASDLAVYKQQLAEVEDELARGLLGQKEAEAARVEISRRILKASEAEQAGGGASTSANAPYVVVAMVAILGMGAYLVVGSPDLPDQPLSARVLAPENNPSVEALIAQVEERLRKNPEDGQGWSVISHVFMRLGRYDDAVFAYRRTIELLGSTPERQGDLAEAMTFANGGVVPKEAVASFEAALAANPDERRAEYWLAAEKEQTGDLAEAARRYKVLIGRGLPDEVRGMVQQRLTDIEARISGKPAPAAEGQQEMINSMVSGLAERLKQDGSDLEGWLKLMRAYTVLGRRDDAMNAMLQAKTHFSGNQEALAKIEEFAKSLGLQS